MTEVTYLGRTDGENVNDADGMENYKPKKNFLNYRVDIFPMRPEDDNVLSYVLIDKINFLSRNYVGIYLL